MRAYLPVVAVALSVCVLVYTITGVFGYLTFHGRARSDILRNYCPQDPAVDVARVMLMLVIVTSYPILAFCGRYIHTSHITLWYKIRSLPLPPSRTALDYRVQQLLHQLIPNTAHLPWWERVRLGVEGTLWLLLSLLLALFVPEISYVINPIGGLAAILMFVFPGI